MKQNIYFLSIIVLSIFIGCEEEKMVPLKGDIVGFVKLWNEEGDEVLNRSDVKVTLDEDHIAYTDSIGKFEFNGIPVGIYNLLFEKENFGTYKRFAMGFTGGNKPSVITDVHLAELPSIEILSIDIETDDFGIHVSGTTTETTGYNFKYYFSGSPLVSDLNSDYSYGYSFCCAQLSSFSHHLYLDNSEFHSGQKVYMAIYAVNYSNQYGRYSYYDFEIDKTIDPSSKRLTNSIEFIVP